MDRRRLLVCGYVLYKTQPLTGVSMCLYRWQCYCLSHLCDLRTLATLFIYLGETARSDPPSLVFKSLCARHGGSRSRRRTLRRRWSSRSARRTSAFIAGSARAPIAVGIIAGPRVHIDFTARALFGYGCFLECPSHVRGEPAGRCLYAWTSVLQDAAINGDRARSGRYRRPRQSVRRLLQ